MQASSKLPQSPSCDVPRANILGIGVHATNPQQVVKTIHQLLSSGQKHYVCVTGVHGVMEAQRDASFKQVLNRASLVTPDGMPTVWVGRLQGHRTMSRVFGPDLMLEVCKASLSSGFTHFLYGGSEGVADELRDNLIRRFPGLKVLGTYTPPFRALNEAERTGLVRTISDLRPDIIWVGLSTPKQEKFMAEYSPLLDAKLMFGVGAAFDLHTGRIRDCGAWMKQAGLQWLHRLWQEPRRLWKRYLINNPLFLLRISLQLLGIRQYQFEGHQ